MILVLGSCAEWDYLPDGHLPSVLFTLVGVLFFISFYNDLILISSHHIRCVGGQSCRSYRYCREGGLVLEIGMSKIFR